MKTKFSLLLLLFILVLQAVNAQRPFGGGALTLPIAAANTNLNESKHVISLVHGGPVGPASLGATVTIPSVFTTSLNSGDEFLLIQMEGPSVGRWMFVRYIGQSSGGTTISLLADTFRYTCNGVKNYPSETNFVNFTTGSDNLQLVYVPRFLNLSFSPTGSLTCDPYDPGTGVGGVVTFKVANNLTLRDNCIDVAGKGYPGSIGGSTGGNAGVGGNGGAAGSLTTKGGKGGNFGQVFLSGICCGGDGGEKGDDGTSGSLGSMLYNPGFSGTNASILGCTTFVKRPVMGSGAKGSRGSSGSFGAGGGGGGAGANATAGSPGGNGVNGVAGVNGGPGGGIIIFGAKNILNGPTPTPYLLLNGMPGQTGIDNVVNGNAGGDGGADGGGGGDGGKGGNGGHAGSGGAGGAWLGYAGTFIPTPTTITWRNNDGGAPGMGGAPGPGGAPGNNNNGCDTNSTCGGGGGGGDSLNYYPCEPDTIFKYLQLIKNNNPDPVITTADEVQYGNANYTVTIMKPTCANPNDGRIIKLNIGRPITTRLYYIFMEDTISNPAVDPIACIDNIYNGAAYSINISKNQLQCNSCSPIYWKLSCTSCFRNKPRWGPWGDPGENGDPGDPGVDDFGQVDDPSGEGNGGPCIVNPLFNFMPIGCNEFQFMNMSSGNGTLFYSWDFGDNGSSIDMNPTHQYTTPGVYTICLTVTNFINGISCSLVYCMPVNIQTISVDIIGDNVVCPGQTKTITAQPMPPGAYSYSWNPATLPSTQSVNVGAGTYTVTITDANGCTATATKTLTESPAFTASITGNLSICPGATTTLTASPSGNYTYSWSTNPIQTSQSVTVGAGTYTVVVTDANGCTKSSVVTVVANGTCCYEPDFCYSIDNRTLRINSVSPSGGYTYKWYFGNGATSTNTSLIYTYPNTNPQQYNYTVCLEVSKVINGIPCCKRICKEIHLVPLCNASVINAVLDYSMNGNTITPMTSGTFKAPIGSYIKITYGSQPFAPPTYIGTITNLNSLPSPLSIRRTYTVDGTYEMCIQLIYTNGTDTCIDESCRTVVINSCNTIASFKMTHCAQTKTFTYTPLVSPGGNVTWDFGDGSTATSTGLTPVIHTYTTNGLYKVCMSVENGTCKSKTCYLINANAISKQPCLGSALLPSPIGSNSTNPEEIVDMFQLNVSDTQDMQTTLFPNPTSNTLNIAMGSKMERSILLEVLTLDGKVMLTEKQVLHIGDNLLELQVGQYQDGLYILRLHADDELIIKKFNISH